MIPVTLQPEPANFDKDVRRPGDRYLAATPAPSNWKNREYWRKVIPELRSSYQSVCAYSCHWIARDTGADTVEHFIPKSINPALAYQWDNYRFVCSRLNGRKGVHQDVLDPFALQQDWFVLAFPSLLVAANPDLDGGQKDLVKATIDRLQLNDDETCVKARLDWLMPYCDGETDFPYLQRRAPFIAYELQRQALVETIKSMMRRRR